MKKTLFITAALLMGSASYASANIENKQTMINGNAELRGQYHQRPTFAQLDSNSDGVLTKDEVRGRLLTNFDKFDIDGSGALSSDEFAAIKKNHHKRPTFALFDSNSDGVLSKDEVRGRLLTNFDKFDTDGSGSLESDEFAVIKKNRQGKRHQRSTFAQLDSNSDGVLTKDEVRGRLLTNFDKFDIDGSGTLSSDEFAAIKKNHHQRPTFALLDSNSDGVLSKDEVRGRLLTNFDKFDTDGSGSLESDEFAVIKKNRQGKRHQRSTFAQLDSNSDGVLTKDEVRGRLLTNFDKFDIDGSGTLSSDEFAAIKKNHHQRPTFAQLDSNGDGVLSKDEVRGRLLTHFDKFDTDGNGMLSSNEFAAIKKMGKARL